MPTNLYGPGDNFDLRLACAARPDPQSSRGQGSGAKANRGLGNGTPRRELLFSDDLADACVFLMNLEGGIYSSLLDGVPLINIGTGIDVTIRELAEQVCAALGFAGELVFDTTKPDGTPRSCST